MLKNANVLFIWKLYDLSTSVYMSCKCENIFPIVVKKKILTSAWYLVFVVKPFCVYRRCSELKGLVWWPVCSCRSQQLLISRRSRPQLLPVCRSCCRWWLCTAGPPRAAAGRNSWTRPSNGEENSKCKQLRYDLCRAVDPHSFFSDPYPAVSFNADSNSAGFLMRIQIQLIYSSSNYLVKSFLPLIKTKRKDC